MHRSHNKAEIESLYTRSTGEEGELSRFQEEMLDGNRGNLANWIRENPPVPANEAEALKAEAELLRKQNRELHTKLAKLKAKTAHHLRERDRYRDLYLNATSKLSP